MHLVELLIILTVKFFYKKDLIQKVIYHYYDIIKNNLNPNYFSCIRKFLNVNLVGAARTRTPSATNYDVHSPI